MDADLVAALRSRHVDVLTTREAGMLNEPDEKNLQYASDQGRVLYSFNIRDYYRIHSHWIADGRTHSGMVLAQQQRLSVGEQVHCFIRLLNERSAVAMQNHVEFLANWSR